MSYSWRIKELLKNYYPIEPKGDMNAFLDYFQRIYSNHLLSVILYGSCLNESTKKPTSIYDFYVVLDSVLHSHRGILHKIVNKIMPPNVYFLQVRTSDNILASAKFNLLSLKDLSRETSLNAHDLFNLGRFGKRLGILYIREDVREEIIDCIYNALLANAWLTLSGMDGYFTLDKFILSLLTLSYMGEIRIERDTKVNELFDCEKDFYRKIYGMILDEFAIHSHEIIKEDDNYSVNLAPDEKNRRKSNLERLIRKSRIRSVLRWPKGIFTFGNYVDYLLLKVERSKGVRIELTPWERRLPLILGWRHFFRLRRKGMIK